MKTEIVWLEDPTKYTYLREGTYLTIKPRQIPIKTPIINGQAKLVGYEIVIPGKGETRPTYKRRFWALKKHDRDLDPEGVYKFNHPNEAVIPSSINIERESIRYKNSDAARSDYERWRKSKQ